MCFSSVSHAQKLDPDQQLLLALSGQSASELIQFLWNSNVKSMNFLLTACGLWSVLRLEKEVSLERVTKPNGRMSGWIITVGLLNNREYVQSSRHCIRYVPKNSEFLQHCETTTSNVTFYKAGREMLSLPKVTQLECSWVNLSSGRVPAETALHHYTTEKML